MKKFWYHKLHEVGFEDAETDINNTVVLKQTTLYPFRSTAPIIKFIASEYFYIISKKIFDVNTKFRNEMDKYILIRHSEGARICKIVDELFERGTPRTRLSVRCIIRRYEMKWDIMYYTPKQLNIYKRL